MSSGFVPMSPHLSSPNPHASGGQGRGRGRGGGMGRGQPGGRDRSIIHKTVRIIKGPYKG